MTTPVLITCLDASQASQALYVRRGFRIQTSTPATLTTSLGSNADLTYTSKLIGTSGNSITVAYTVGSALTAPTVSVSTDAITVNITSAATDTVTTSGTPASVRATGTITVGTEPSDGDTVTVGGKAYTFKTTLGSSGAVPYQVLIGGSNTAAALNLQYAINNTGGTAGTNYGTGGVANAYVTASTTTDVCTVTAITYDAALGNALTVATSDSGKITVPSTLSGGTNETVTVQGQAYTFVEALTTAADGGLTAYEVLINGQDTSLTNLASAINGSTGAGTIYGTGTVANTSAFVPGVVASHAITLQAITSGSGGNSLTLAKSGSHLSVGNATFQHGGTTSGAWTTTAAQVEAAVQASSTANALVDVEVASGQNGTGDVSTLSATSLAGGAGPSTRYTGAVLSGTENETVIQPGVIYEVNVDDPQTRKILSRYYLRWFEVPGGDLTKVPIRSLLLSDINTQVTGFPGPQTNQSFISRGTPFELEEIDYQTVTSGAFPVAIITGPGGETVEVALGAAVVDLTQPEIRRAVRQHRDQLVSSNSTNTLVTIRGLVTTSSTPEAGFPGAGLSAGRGFRINKYGAISQASGANNVAYVYSTANVQVDTSDFNVRRALRRNIGRWIVVSTP